jgi:argininosuccinate lyase
MTEINASIGFDRKLWAEDIAGSKAHCAMLVRQGILNAAEGKAILGGLDRIARELSAGKFAIKPELEDIHMHIEARLGQLIGAPAGRLHTARSRNDQVATDLRLWLRASIDRLHTGMREVQRALLGQAAKHVASVMPGFTHLQAAQPVTLAHHLLAYVEMLERDKGRLQDCRLRLNECPLGACALAGTSFPIDRDFTAKALGFDRPMANSLDAVSARDFALEFLAAAAIAAVHLSKLAEEIVLWSSTPFAFVEVAEEYSSGSSIMPQKRNPDAAELIRAKVGRIGGALAALLAVTKGLPLAYAKDLQEDKEPVFDAAHTLDLALTAMAGMVQGLKFDKARMRALAQAGFSTATDLADWLVKSHGLAFRQAHHVVGRLVRLAERKGVSLEDLPLSVYRAAVPKIGRDVYRVLDPDRAVASRTSFGGTAPDQVRAQLKFWRQRLPAKGDGSSEGKNAP